MVIKALFGSVGFMNLELDETENEFLEQKSEETDLSISEYISLLISRDMAYDCSYIQFDKEKIRCSINGESCPYFEDGSPITKWVNSEECDIAIDHEYDLKTVDGHRGV